MASTQPPISVNSSQVNTNICQKIPEREIDIVMMVAQRANPSTLRAMQHTSIKWKQAIESNMELSKRKDMRDSIRITYHPYFPEKQIKICVRSEEEKEYFSVYFSCIWNTYDNSMIFTTFKNQQGYIFRSLFHDTPLCNMIADYLELNDSACELIAEMPETWLEKIKCLTINIRDSSMLWKAPVFNILPMFKNITQMMFFADINDTEFTLSELKSFVSPCKNVNGAAYSKSSAEASEQVDYMFGETPAYLIQFTVELAEKEEEKGESLKYLCECAVGNKKEISDMLDFLNIYCDPEVDHTDIIDVQFESEDKLFHIIIYSCKIRD